MNDVYSYIFEYLVYVEFFKRSIDESLYERHHRLKHTSQETEVCATGCTKDGNHVIRNVERVNYAFIHYRYDMLTPLIISGRDTSAT